MTAFLREGVLSLSTALPTSAAQPPPPRAQAQAKAKAAPPPAPLDSGKWRKFKLSKRENLTNTANPTVLFRLELPDQNSVAGLPVASCLLVRVPITKKDGTPGFALRPYTPVSAPSARGHFDLVVKIYKEPKAGVVGSHLDSLNIGDEVEVKGPLPKIPFEDIVKRTDVGFVAGGSGITPILQVAEEILRARAPTRLSLIFANVSEEEIILRQHIDELAAKHDNFNVHYIVDKADKSWKGSVGYITKDLLKSKLPAPSDKSLVLVCGPPPMMSAISGEKAKDKSQGELSGFLKELGYSEDNVYKF